jgi:hypothetical protein
MELLQFLALERYCLPHCGKYLHLLRELLGNIG